MKKLMVALSAIAMAVAAQASTVTWSYSGDIVTRDFPGSGSTEDYYVPTADAYVLFLGATGSFEVAEDGTVTLNGGAVQATTGTVGDGLAALEGSVTAQNGVYTLLIVSTDGGQTWYGTTTATASAFTADPADTKPLEFAVENIAFDAGYEPLALSTQAVPEPTSGLLLLLGVAGLALKRRRA